MSVQMNTYVLHGVLMPYEQMTGRYEAFEPYMDSAFDGIRHHDGLCVLYDGMDGKYVAIGRVLAKTPNHEGFVIPIRISALAAEITDEDELRDKISALSGTPKTLETFVITHYR